MYFLLLLLRGIQNHIVLTRKIFSKQTFNATIRKSTKVLIPYYWNKTIGKGAQERKTCSDLIYGKI
jgi:uncharacterized protein YycO